MISISHAEMRCFEIKGARFEFVCAEWATERARGQAKTF